MALAHPYENNCSFRLKVRMMRARDDGPKNTRGVREDATLGPRRRLTYYCEPKPGNELSNDHFDLAYLVNT